jgi:hypothetical protein
MAPLPRHDHNEGPPTPGEYILLLIILVAVGISYIVWWRHRGGQTSFA